MDRFPELFLFLGIAGIAISILFGDKTGLVISNIYAAIGILSMEIRKVKS